MLSFHGKSDQRTSSGLQGFGVIRQSKGSYRFGIRDAVAHPRRLKHRRGAHPFHRHADTLVGGRACNVRGPPPPALRAIALRITAV
jgi:hypothetical protein